MNELANAPLELGMQELEAMEAPGWGTFWGVVTGVTVVSAVGTAVSYGVTAIMSSISVIT
ncbi:daptide-type RiPP [Nonomuraea insulae]|uniref:Daptide-type RiPP n=1 Tax=Nonomuraea insulae TaxID=1616787 RepID=A0ABW1CQ85_9ACTN